MKARTLQQLLLYNYRYLFAYICLFIFGSFFLFWRLWDLPAGLAAAELNTAARHTSLIDILQQPIYPLHAFLQWLSMDLLGTSPLAIRLPSSILAGLTVLVVYNILKRWFGKPAALLGSTLMISADWFLYIGRLGTGSIELTFWLSIAILSLIKLLGNRSWWLPVLGLALGALLFVPFGIYAAVVFVACLGGISTFRSRILAIKKYPKIVSVTILAISLVLLIASLINNPGLARHLLGSAQSLPYPGEYLYNIIINSSGAVAILPDNNPVTGLSGVLYVRFFEFIFILFGIIMLWRTRINKLNFVIIALSIVLAIFSGLSDGSRGSSLLILPAIIFITAGLRYFMHRWQKTFPKNPYARIVAYAPMALLLSLVLVVHYYTYFRIWSNQTPTRQAFSQQFTLLRQELNDPGQCFILDAPEPIQRLASLNRDGCQVTFSDRLTVEELTPGQRVIVSPENIESDPLLEGLTARPLSDDLKDRSIHWWVLTPSQTPDIMIED